MLSDRSSPILVETHRNVSNISKIQATLDDEVVIARITNENYTDETDTVEILKNEFSRMLSDRSSPVQGKVQIEMNRNKVSKF